MKTPPKPKEKANVRIGCKQPTLAKSSSPEGAVLSFLITYFSSCCDQLPFGFTNITLYKKRASTF